MSTSKYALGVDFGTESGRTVIVDVRTGRELATAVYQYANGVIDERLPTSGARLPPDWALQDPADYLRTLTTTIPLVLQQAGVAADDVLGIGIDFTACTMLPVDAAGQALCFDERFKDEPHAWVKLWKHHAAQPEADEVNRVARERGEAFLSRYGGKISSEWMIPKILQILNEAPHVYHAAARFMEAADWVILQLTGQERRNACTAGYKAIWAKDTGYPTADYFAALHPSCATSWPTSSVPTFTHRGNVRGSSRRRWQRCWVCGQAPRWRWPMSTRTSRSRRAPLSGRARWSW